MDCYSDWNIIIFDLALYYHLSKTACFVNLPHPRDHRVLEFYFSLFVA